MGIETNLCSGVETVLGPGVGLVNGVRLSVRPQTPNQRTISSNQKRSFPRSFRGHPTVNPNGQPNR